MKFKKGDLVEVIKEDEYHGFPFFKGSKWIVYEDQSDYNDTIKVHDDRHIVEYSVLWASRVKKIERFEPRFKVGDMVKVKSSTYIDDPSIGNIYRVANVVNGLTTTEGIVYLYTGVNNDHTRLWVYNFNEVELANDNSDMELDIIQDKNIKIKHLEKLNEALTNNNRIIAVFNNQLMEENKDLQTRISCLETEKIHYAQRVRVLTEENEILKDDLQRKKFFKNFFTGNKD